MGLPLALSKRRNLIGIVLFVLLVSRVTHLHYERNRLWNDILTKYDSDTSDKRLAAGDMVKFLKDSGVNVTKAQLQDWLGKVDDEQDGYDKGELLEVIDFFDDMDSWKTKGRLSNIAQRHMTEGTPLSAIGDVFFLFIVGGMLLYFLINSEAMEKRVAANSFVSAVKVAGMKKKWKTLESNIEGYNNEREELKQKIVKLEEESEQALTLGERTVSKAAEGEATRKTLLETQQELARVNKMQTDVEKELTRLRNETEDHISEAHMSTTKLQAMRTMLRGVDAIGAASPFQGAGTGQYNSDGAKTGFAMRGRSRSGLLRNQASANSGFRMDSFIFGFPTEDDIVFYEVDKRKDLLGEGADCAYKCRDIATKEQFAVKIYEIKGSDQKRQIINDLHAKQSIGDHPHIVRYHAVVETEEQIFVLMELIPGMDLFSHIVAQGGLDEKRAAKIFQQLCKALLFCHEQDIVHGDVKPENAMVLNPDHEEPTAKLIDFGFSCFGDCSDKRAVSDVYAPREALEGQQSSKAVDSFRLGCTLYVMLMATYPFQKHCRDLAERAAGTVLKYPKWNTLSEEARDLIECLCRDRITIEEAFNHRWTQKHAGNM